MVACRVRMGTRAVPEVIDTVKLSNHELEAILHDLNRGHSGTAAASKRKLKRWPLQLQKAVLTLIDSGGRKSHNTVVPRNLSKRGASVLYGGFVHPGTQCVLSIRCVDGSSRSISAVVRHSRHAKGRLHDLGLEFSQSVDPRDFFIVLGNNYLFNREAVSLKSITGKLLVIEDSIAMQRLIAKDLHEADLTILFAKTAAEGIARLTEEPDVILIDYLLPDGNGLDVMQKIRDLGYTVPCMLMTSERDRELRMAAIGAGAREMLYKPVPACVLHQAIAEYLVRDEEVDSGDHGAEGGGSQSKDDVAVFIDVLLAEGKEMAAALERNNTETVRSCALELVDSARRHGFPHISEQATEVVRIMDASTNLARASGEVKKLIKLCEKTRRVPEDAEPPAADHDQSA